MVVSDEALRRYGDNRFTDSDVTRSSGLSVRAWRELIKLGAVRTETATLGRGYVRLCDNTALKRSAVIGALNRTGLSVRVSGHIAYSLPFHTLLYELCDPRAILLNRSGAVDPQTGLPPRVKKLKLDWFSPSKPTATDPQRDWFLAIYERRFVGAIYDPGDEPTIFGDLRDGGTSFVAWWPHSRRMPRLGRLIREFAPADRIQAAAAAWENPTRWSKELERLGYKFEKHDKDGDPLRIAAQSCARDPVFTTTINVTLAIRKALRRVLDIEPAETRLEDM